jgi:hypothetical protein
VVSSKRWRGAFVAVVLVLFVPVSPGAAELSSAPNACPPAQSPASGVPPAPASPAGPAQPAPEQTLVCVGSEAITGATYLHWLAIAAESQPSAGPRAPSAAELRKQVLAFLIPADWVKGEAHRLRIHVSATEVGRRFYSIRRQQFPKHAEFELFLRQSGETVADLLFRTELNLVSGRIQRHILAGHRGARSQERALSRFVKAFRLRWRAQTYCASSYVTDDCGHVQSTL